MAGSSLERPTTKTSVSKKKKRNGSKSRISGASHTAGVLNINSKASENLAKTKASHSVSPFSFHSKNQNAETPSHISELDSAVSIQGPEGVLANSGD
jgi:hypothetical protein